MTSSADVKAYFDSNAHDWDTMRQDYYGVEVIESAVNAARLPGRGSQEQPITQRVSPRASLPRLLVDVGCGTGFLSAGLSSRANNVIGIDASQKMLDVARENLEALQIDNVELKQGTVDSLPLEEDIAEAVFANMVLHHAEDPQRMVREMARVAMPGGRVVITDMDSHTNEWFKVEMADIWLGFTEAQARQYLQTAGLFEIDFGWVGSQ